MRQRGAIRRWGRELFGGVLGGAVRLPPPRRLPSWEAGVRSRIAVLAIDAWAVWIQRLRSLARSSDPACGA
eukprot:11763602-Alexandrium_andersonii.AAC.1